MNKTADLAYWITERYAMKMRKDANLGPDGMLQYGYSADPYMGTVRYCNVHREDDKVTKWLAKHWRPKYHEVWHIVLARMVNYIPSLEELLPTLAKWDIASQAQLDELKWFMKERRANGEKIWTSAYTISTNGRAMDKVDYVFGCVIADAKAKNFMFNPKAKDGLYLEHLHQDLMRINGLGSFLAAQVIADLKNTKGHPCQKAPDWHTWCAPGPGSLKGLMEYFNRSLPSARSFYDDIAQCWAEVKPLLPDYIPPIHMQDFQNCLCEFSKYERIKAGGHARNRYSPGGD